MSTTAQKSYGSFEMSGDWDAQVKRLKAKYSELTDADLAFESGQLIALVERMEQRLKRGRAEVMSILREAQQSA